MIGVPDGDGLREFEANRTSFENWVEGLAPGGFFIVEDSVWRRANLEKFERMLDGRRWRPTLPHRNNRRDDCLAVIRRPA